MVSGASLPSCWLFLQSQVLLSWDLALMSSSSAKSLWSWWCCLVTLMVRAVNCHNKTLNPGGFNFSSGLCCPCELCLSPELYRVKTFRSRRASLPCNTCCSWPPQIVLYFTVLLSLELAEMWTLADSSELSVISDGFC